MKEAPDHICPRCGGDVPDTEHKGQYPGALSRADNDTEVCSACGQDEALQQFFTPEHQCTPVSEWPIPERVFHTDEMDRQQKEAIAAFRHHLEGDPA
jgi:hypothetical protein